MIKQVLNRCGKDYKLDWVPMTLEEMVQSRLKPGEVMDLFDKEQSNRFYNELKADYLANVKGKDIFDPFYEAPEDEV